MNHAIWCPSCGLFGRKARRRARDAEEALLVNFHRHVAGQIRAERAAERRQAWLDSLPDDTPPWQVREMDAIARDLAFYHRYAGGPT